MKWIDIKKTKPIDNQQVLITNGNMVTAAEADFTLFNNGCISWRGCEFDGYDWEWDFDEESITHWAPLPDPPSQKKE